MRNRHQCGVMLWATTMLIGASESNALGDARSQEQSDGSYGLISWALQGGDGNGAAAGSSAAIDGDIAVVGAPNFHDNRGAAYACIGDSWPDPWASVVDFQSMAATPVGSFFGTAVAVHGSMVAISAPGTNEGAVHTFNRDEFGVWSAGTRIDNPNGPPSGQFGASLALGDVLVIGDPGANDGDGFAYVYETKTGNLNLIATLVGPTHTYPGGNFGNDVALLGTTLAIGAPGPLAGPDAVGGRVSIYEIDLNNQGNPVQLDVVIEGGVFSNLSQFGFSVALSEHGASRALAAGMPGMDLNQGEHGTVEVYRDAGDGSWLLEASLAAEITSNTDGFGRALGMSSELLAIGAPFASSVASYNGVGTIYRYSPSSGTWVLETTIHPSGATGGDTFGVCVSIDSDHVVFGGPGLTSLVGDTGQALLYVDPDGGSWQSDPRPSVPIAFDRSFFSGNAPMPQFGSEIALSGDVALVGSPAARQVHVFRREGAAGTPWQDMTVQVLPPDTNNPPTGFGQVIAMLGDIAVVGAPYADIGGELYVYQDISGMGLDWILMQILTPSVGSSGAFGCEVALTEVGGQTWLAVGDTGNTFDTHNSGEVLLYQWASWQFIHMNTLHNPGYVDGENSFFGGAIDLASSSSSMLIVAAGDVGSGDGRVDIFEQVIGAGFWHRQTLAPPNSYATGFGGSVSFDNELVAVGSSTSAETGNVSVFTRSTGFRGARTGWTDYAFTYQLYSVAGGVADGFASQVEVISNPRRILVSAPGLDYMDTNSGGVYSFSPSTDQPNAWSLDALLLSPSAVGSDAAGPFAVGPDTVLVGCPGADDAVATPRRVLDYSFGDTVSWMWEGGGNISTDSLWSGAPGGNTGRFSLLLADPYSINFDLLKWVGSIEAAFNEVTFELLGSWDREITVDLRISSPAAQGMASVNVTDGILEVGNDLTIGPHPNEQDFYDSAGRLGIDHGAVRVGNRLDIAASSSLVLELVPSRSRTEEEIGPLLSAGQAHVAGALYVALPNGFSGDNFSEGDQIQLLVSQAQPMEGAFDVVVMPGLPGGLAFELSTVASLNGPTGSTLQMTVVSLAGLLDFGDPNSTTVAGDPTGVEIVDLTGDGAEEICVTLAGAPGSLVIFENDGAGGVLQQIVIATGDEPVDISSGDFDGDGNNDLAVANNLSQDVTIYYNDDNDPSNGFNEEDLGVGGPPTCLVGINANFDMYGDLAVGVSDTDGDGNGMYQVYLGVASLRGGMAGGGSTPAGGDPAGLDPSMEEDQKDHYFSGRQSNGKTAVVGGGALASNGPVLTMTQYTTGADPGGMTVADLNGDGHGDICVTSTTNGTVAILLQDVGGGGSFQTAIYVPIGDQPTRITSVDFDSDGHQDLAAIVQEVNPMSGGVESVVRVLQGNGSLGFTSLDTAWGEHTALVGSGDVSGDGLNELVTIGGGAAFRGSRGMPLLSIRGTDTGTCPGDFDANGNVNVDDLLILLGEFSSCTKNCQADMNGDGVVNIDDMLSLIGVWGPC